MKKLILFLGAVGLAYGQQVTISDTLTNTPGGDAWTGTIVVRLNSPSYAYYGTTSLSGWQYVLCVGGDWGGCSAQTAAGVITIPLYATSTMTPSGLSYAATYAPRKGSRPPETWTVTPSQTKLYEIRSSVVPTPTVIFSAGQLALAAGSILYGSSAGVGTALAAGTNGHVLTLSGGYPAWSAAAASATPASATAACTTGAVQFDASYIYVCHATNTWKRAAVATW